MRRLMILAVLSGLVAQGLATGEQSIRFTNAAPEARAIKTNSIASADTYTLTLSSTYGGSVRFPGEGSFKYAPGTRVQLIAVSNVPGYVFKRWSGSITSWDNLVVITVNYDMEITAHFEYTEYKLTVAVSPEAGGGVFHTTGAVSHPGEGSFMYPAGTSVRLSASESAGYTFTGWSGSVRSVANPLRVTLNSDMVVKANFAYTEYVLTTRVTPTDGGTVQRTPDQTRIPKDTTVFLVAKPAPGYTFKRWSWSGLVWPSVDWDGSVDDPRIGFCLLSNASFTAYFEAREPPPPTRVTLIVSSTPGGRVSEPGEGRFEYEKNAVVWLRAKPDPGYEFSHWSNSSTRSTKNPMRTTMNRSKGFKANFIIIRPKYKLDRIEVSNAQDVSTGQPLTGRATIWSEDDPKREEKRIVDSIGRFPWLRALRRDLFRIHFAVTSDDGRVGLPPTSRYVWFLREPNDDTGGTILDTDEGVIPKRWDGSFDVQMPMRVGKYELTLVLSDDDRRVLYRPQTVHPLYATYLPTYANEPLHAGSLERATEWASGAWDTYEVASYLNKSMYEYGQKWWKYGHGRNEFFAWDGYPYKEDWKELLKAGGQEEKARTDCGKFMLLWKHLARVNGLEALPRNVSIDVSSSGGLNDRGPFVTKPVASAGFKGIPMDGQPSNAFPSGASIPDRWVFRCHYVGALFGTLPWPKYFDPTFGDEYANAEDCVDWWFQGPDFNAVNKDLDFGSYVVVRHGAATEDHPWGWFEYRRASRSPSVSIAGISDGGASFTGEYSCSGQDKDSDGIFNCLVAHAELYIESAGTYSVRGALRSAQGAIISMRSTKSSVLYAQYNVIASQPGMAMATLEFSGEDIFDSGVDGTYKVELSILDESGVACDSRSFDAGPFSHTEFGELPARLGTILDYAVDADTDGLLDALSLDVEVEILQEDAYCVSAGLHTADGGWVTSPVASGPITESDVVTLNFSGNSIRKSGRDGPYVAVVSLNSTTDSQIDHHEHTTAAYSHTEFAQLPHRFTAAYSESTADADENGLFDSLDIEVGVHVDEAGTYDINGWLYDDANEVIGVAGCQVALEAGDRVVPLHFSGPGICLHGSSGKYHLRQLTLGLGDEIADFVDHAYTTADYLSTDFERPGLSAGDVNGDLVVNAQDLVVIGANWLRDNCAYPDWCDGADLDFSGTVDLRDYSMLAFDWQKVEIGGVQPSGLVAHWKFDEGAGSVAEDSAGGSDGAVYGAAWTEGIVGGALQFDGVDDYVDCAGSSLFDMAGALTVAAWINASASNTPRQAIVTKGDAAWRIERNGSTAAVGFACVGLDARDWGLWGAVPTAPGEWHHVAGVYDGEGMYLYVDGVLDAFQHAHGFINVNSLPVLIGENAETPGCLWKGRIDDVRIYGDALSDSEIRELMQAAEPADPSQPVTLTISSSTGGSVCLVSPDHVYTPIADGAYTYTSGEEKYFCYQLDAGYRFVGWSGTLVDAAKIDPISPCAQFTIDGDYTLIASFEPIELEECTLTISSTSGGSVEEPGEGVFTYEKGTEVSLLAVADSEYEFTGWSGSVSSSSNPLTITMDHDVRIKANFEPEECTLTLSSSEGGSVWTSPYGDADLVPDGTYTHPCGTELGFYPKPDEGYWFDSWTGTLLDAGKIPPASAWTSVYFALDGDYTLVANFIPIPPVVGTLTISSSGGGFVRGRYLRGTQWGSSDLMVPLEGTYECHEGGSFHLSLVAFPGYHFVEWTGTAIDAGKVASAPTSGILVVADGDYSIVANFEPD
ncbi:MAG: hypothetical protein JW741_24020 [Sedimentisphaerales bacterium]|nr:hypothetical protein [Sedimentisphaerales bacterium]